MSAYQQELQKAIIATLKADTGLANLLRLGSNQIKIYDAGGAPASQPFPYITVGHVSETPMNTFGRAGARTLIDVTHWSEQAGFTECRELNRRTYALLDNAKFSLSQGLTLVYFNFFSSVAIEEEEATHRRIATTYAAMTQAA